MSLPLTTPAVDWTALRNFAMLRGQLRVSLTPRCNINCWFCHNEGDIPPPFTHLNRDAQPRARELGADNCLGLIHGMMTAELKRVYFTGGEPLASPLAQPVLTRLPAAGPDASYTLVRQRLRHARPSRPLSRREHGFVGVPVRCPAVCGRAPGMTPVPYATMTLGAGHP